MNQLYGKARSSVGSLFDVHKHLVLICALEQLKQNTRRFHYIDAHAGAGGYDLDVEEATSSSSFGVQCLLDANKNEMTERYIEIVKGFNSGLPLTKYPGSPIIARKLIRASDSMSLIELNTEEFSELSRVFQVGSNVSIDHGSAFDRVVKHIPVGVDDGLILIDPDYIIDEDATDTANLIIQCRAKWPSAMIMVTLPVTGSTAKDRYVISILKDSGVSKFIVSDLAFIDFTGLGGNGVNRISRTLMVNPRYDIKNTLESVLSQLASSLPASIKAKSRVELT
ncbi:23S rRNA (adenine(2030)-N(6))-methyltransferase RlmJ [Alkalimarinus alittae]|uniref:23S rRNA (Adenine(2030)-N(6))-methyltransferase RlmJ n=1 Tax=Alkalimarinus alittae TaxID=2961619 RepID=A0ABY6N6P3_9ALTE|nr:23S rRNA (adenine(2030)-N(6))-methyltransferase RlmJ [Alkalimarinus alittae]UZE97782.1 23S rRNA (adenine(2030)-N(6))-methyltransferase RlmJ [Alkalimarinus alittae]